MHQHPGFTARAPPHPHQLIGQAPAELCIMGDLLEFFVQELIAARPVDLGMGIGEEEGEKVRQVTLQDLLPGTIVITRWRRQVDAPFARSPLRMRSTPLLS